MDSFTFFWFFIMPIVGLVLSVSTPVLFGLFWFRWLPPVSKILYRAKRKRLIPAVITHDSGRSAIKLFVERRGEGVLITEDGKKYKICPRYVGLPTKRTEQKKQSNTEKTGNPGEKEDLPPGVSKMYSDIITKRSLMTGLDLPWLNGYSGSMCLLNAETLAMVEAGDMKVETEGLNLQVTAENKDVKDIVEPLLLLDARRSKEILNSSFDESQMGAVVVDSEEIGRLGRPRDWGKYAPYLMIGMLIVLGVVSLLFAPKLLQDFIPSG